jgi:hypothetical protein
MLINHLDVRIIQATTGELIRALILNPAIDYQTTQGVRRPRPKPSYGFDVSPMSCDITLEPPRGDRTPDLRITSRTHGVRMSPITATPVRWRPRWSVEVLLLGCHRGCRHLSLGGHPRNDLGATMLAEVEHPPGRLCRQS